MRVMLVIGALKSGGAERVMTNLANYLSKLGDDVLLVAIHYAVPVYQIAPEVEFINGLGSSNQLYCIKKLHELLKSKKPEVALSFMTHINISLIIAKIGTGIPVIVSERNDPKRIPPEKYRRILRRILYPFADGYVFQTKEAQDFFNDKIKIKSRIIINPCEVTVSPTPVDARSNDIVTVGRLMPQKNQRMLIEAFASVKEKVPGYHLHIFGDGPLRQELKELIHKYDLDDNVILHGAVTDLHEQMKNYKIFVLSSDYEGMPNALLEAMKLGMACICTDCPCGGPRMIITEGENGMLFPVSDKVSLEDILIKLMSDNELCKKLGKAAINKSLDFSSEIIFDEWRSYLQKKAR